MIKAKHDGQYKQVGFIKVRQPDGTYKDVEKKYGKINGGEYGLVFEKGFTREVEGALPLTLNGIGKQLKDYSIYGNTFQSDGVSPDTPQEVVGCGDRTGNLLKLTDDYVADIRGVSVSIKNGTLSIKGTADSSGGRNIYLSEAFTLKAGTYILSGTAVSGLRYCLSKVADGSAITATYGQAMVTLTEDAIVAFGLNFIEGTTYDATVNVMLNTGSTPLPYEPYRYKVDVETKGKNLFDADTVYSGITKENGVFKSSSPYTVGQKRRHFTTDEIGKTFTFSMNLKEVERATENPIKLRVSAKIGSSYIHGSPVTSSVAIGTKIKSVVTVTPTSVEDFIFIDYGSTGAFEFDSPQLELGAEATEYEPYVEPITTPIYLDSPLYKIGDYADSRGKTEEVRVVKELVLTGEEPWEFRTGEPDNVYFFAYSDMNISPVAGVGASNCYLHTSGESYGTLLNNEFIFGNTTFGVRDTRFSNSVYSFKSYLSAQYANGTPVKVYYVLAEPETKAVESTEIPTLNGTTVIDVDTKITPSNMWVKYKSSK